MPGATPGTDPFRQTRQVKERSTYFAALRNGDAENWFGQLVSDADPTVVPRVVAHGVPGAPAVLELALQGVTLADSPGANHRVAVSVNGRPIDEVAFSGQERAVFRVPLPADVLRDGDNNITLLALDGGSDISLIDVVTVSYAHTHQADADQLLFTAEGQQTVAIGGFSTPSIRAVDVTDPSAVIDVLAIVRAEDGLYTATLVAPGVGTRRLFAFTDFTTATPASLAANEPTAWHAATSAFDYVVLARRDYFEALRPLAVRRASQGYRPAVIDIQDVYDEFSFGEKSPVAIRRFLTRARASWQAAPRFLVLAGDATLDPRDYAGLGDFDLIPTKLLSMSQVALETASDEWFADLNDDGLPGVAVGRLPVRTVAQAEAMVRKILAYETQAPGAWASDVTFVADDNDAANDFEGATRAIEAGLPAGYTAHEVFRGTLAAGAGAALASEVSAGRLIVNYLGHGSTRLWGLQGDLLSNDQVASSWQGGSQLPFVLAMNCLSGFFHGIYDEESLAEALLRAPDRGAIAAWASSSLTSSATQQLVSRELFRLLLQDGRLTLGEAAVRAKRVVSQRDLRRSWIFFGDPATRLIGVQPGPDATQALDTLDSADAATAAPTDEAAQTSVRQVRLADVDGDGRDDLLVYRPETGEWQAWSAQGSYLRGGRWPAHLDVRAAHLHTGRFADLFLYAPATGAWFELVNDGQSFVTTSGAMLPDADVRLADVDGDGRDDVFLYQAATGTWSLALNDGQGGFSANTGQWTPGLTVRLADFDGGGRAGFFTYDRTTGRWQVLDQPDGTAARAGRTSRGWEVAVTRLDADNRADLLMHDPATGRWETWVNPTRGTFAIRRTSIWPAGRIAQVADVAGEGLDVAFLYRPETGEWAFAPLTDAGAPAAAGIGPRGADLAMGDIDGDGLTEFYLYQRSTGDVLLVDAEPGARIVVGRAAWPTGWALSGAQPAEPTTLARLEATGPWPIASPRLYIVDRHDVEAALQAVGLPQVVARRPPTGRYDGNYAGGSTTAPMAAASAAAARSNPSAPSIQPGASTPQASALDAAVPVPEASLSATVTAASSPSSVVAPTPAPADASPSATRTLGMSAYTGSPLVVSRQREVAPALLDGSTGDPLALEPPTSATSAMTAATEAVTGVTDTAAVLHGTIGRGTPGTRAGFLWGADKQPGTLTELVAPEISDPDYFSTLTDLRADTVYYFRAVVDEPGGGRLLGEILTWRTLPAAAVRHEDSSQPSGK
ncbi:MAG: C25 family cysteine peptidase [Candidatus Limnocylindrales bacterium]